MSDSFKADMDEALARFSAASGLQFVYGGETSITPYQATDWYLQTDNTQQTLIIAILDEARVPQLAGTTAGLGGAAWLQYGSDAPRYYVAAVVVDGLVDADHEPLARARDDARAPVERARGAHRARAARGTQPGYFRGSGAPGPVLRTGPVLADCLQYRWQRGREFRRRALPQVRAHG